MLTRGSVIRPMVNHLWVWTTIPGSALLHFKYNPNRGLYHFRWFWDYSGGQMTNLGAHHLDIVDWYLGLDQLRSVTSIGGRFALRDNGETPDTQDVIFDCGKFTVAFVMREAARGEPSGFGLRFHGTKGTLAIDRRGFKVWADPDIPPANMIPGIKEGHPVDGPRMALDAIPKSRTESLEDKTGDSASQYREHAANFLDCIRTRKTPISDLVSAQRTVRLSSSESFAPSRAIPALGQHKANNS